MNAQVKLSEFTPSRVRQLYEAGTSLMLLGSPGIGKSSIIREWPEMLSGLYGEEFGWFEIYPALGEAPDAKGYMIPAKDKDGKAISVFTYPPYLPSREYLEKHPRGVLNIEEFDQCAPDMAKALAQLIYEKKIGEYKLPDGWWVVSSSNRTKDKSGAVRQLMHIVNRQRRIEVANDIDGLCAWMEARSVHPMLIAFTRARPSVVFTDAVPSSPDPFCTPRSLVSAAKFIQTTVDNDNMDFRISDFDQMMVAGDIGQAAAAELFGFAEVRDVLPTRVEIEETPAKAKVPPASRLDALFAVNELIVSSATAKTMDAYMVYIARVSPQMSVATIKRLIAKNPLAAIESKLLREWISKNQNLLTKTLM